MTWEVIVQYFGWCGEDGSLFIYTWKNPIPLRLSGFKARFDVEKILLFLKKNCFLISLQNCFASRLKQNCSTYKRAKVFQKYNFMVAQPIMFLQVLIELLLRTLLSRFCRSPSLDVVITGELLKMCDKARK